MERGTKQVHDNPRRYGQRERPTVTAGSLSATKRDEKPIGIQKAVLEHSCFIPEAVAQIATRERKQSY